MILPYRRIAPKSTEGACGRMFLERIIIQDGAVHEGDWTSEQIILQPIARGIVSETRQMRLMSGYGRMGVYPSNL